MNDIATDLLKYFATATMAVLVPAAFSLLRTWTAKIKSDRLRAIVDDVVNAVEKQFQDRDVDGGVKKAAAQNLLAERGVDVTDPKVDTMLEASVNRLL